MRPKGIWIAIGLILAVGISSTRLVRQYTSEPLRTKAAETVMENEVPEIAAFSAGLEQEEPSERTVRIPEAAMAQLKESEQEAETEAATETALEYGQAPVATMAEAVPEQEASKTKSAFEKGAGFVQEDTAMPAPAAEIQQPVQADGSPVLSAGNSKKEAGSSGSSRVLSPPAVSAEASSAKQPGRQDVLERLEELDRQIEKKRSAKQDATANSAKAVAESERKLWENELNQLLSRLRSHMSSDTWDAFMKDQNEWIRSREAMAVDALSGNSGSAMQELEYTRSLTEITRDRAYELAEEYYDVLSETE